MKKISTGKVYEYNGVYVLVLIETDTPYKPRMYWCALDWTQNIDNLVNVYNCLMITPHKEWRYIETLSNEEYAQALANFRVHQEKRIYGCKTNSNKIKKLLNNKGEILIWKRF